MKSWRLMMCVLITAFIAGCSTEPPYEEKADNPAYLHETVKHLTDVIVHDIFSPPVASRIYTYSAIAAYEVMAAGDSTYRSLAGQLNELKPVPQPEEGKAISYPLAAVYAHIQTGKALIFSEAKMEEFKADILSRMQAEGIPQGVYDRSIEYGQAVSDHILKWSKEDHYSQTRTYPKYSISNNPAYWQPTPPDYMEGIEPHWAKIRTFVLDSAQQFIPPPPTEYSDEKGSQFYEEAMEVYDAVAESTEEMTEIAQFWDCNPYVSHHMGHVMFATKKITPGGHWVGITGLACRKAGADFGKSAEAYVRVTLALVDGFISCWDEKYRSILVRPETFINKYVDAEWKPILQTPPFPEHTSGHSVISSAAGEVLTDLFGDNFAFTDSVEVEYGLPIRSFDSFRDAYQEAAISRLYGGIHYMPAIEYGVAQGRKVGALVIERVETSTD